MESQKSGGMEEKRPGIDSDKEMKTTKNKKKINRKKKRSAYMQKFGCFRSNDDYPTIEEPDGNGSFDVEAVSSPDDRSPSHLIIMVNGILGSAQNWRFAAKQFLKKHPHDVLVHCSECNTSTLTFDGVDIMGRRLADEVMSVVNRHPDLMKISFVGHSLGGLVARYAISVLYKRDNSRIFRQENGENGSEDQASEMKGKIAGLEPVNFITSATPHLGCRGHKQVPVFCGFYGMEKAASHISWFLGRTGRHLFLTDKDKGKPPLLLQMASDCEDLKFISALQAFKRRLTYANMRYDHIVGWSTSSLRRRSELPKLKQLSRNDRYPHIVNIEDAKPASPQQEEAPSQAKPKISKTAKMEETMLRALTKMSWERVDVNFKGSKQRYLAHSTIQVKTHRINSDGADVVQHMVDSFLL